MKIVLGIETSCDETAVAVVTSDKRILSHIVLSQIEQHQPYGGVVPEIAARAHIDAIGALVKQATQEAGIADYSKLDAVAVTAGPGLIGGVIVGVMTAKAIASAAQIPIIAVNHLEGHALTIRLTDHVDFPFMMLLASGGHCQVLAVEGVGKYKKLGATIDDSLGEAFDKVAKMMGLGYPGGPIVEKLALEGNPERFIFPRSLKGREGCDFSFSGLKTAVKREVDSLDMNMRKGLQTTSCQSGLSEQDKKDISASFQNCVGDILEDRLTNAINMFSQLYPDAKTLVLAGGVAANKYVNSRLASLVAKHGFELKSPPIKLCTDNGAMIAWAGIERLNAGFVDDVGFKPRARWPLEE